MSRYIGLSAVAPPPNALNLSLYSDLVNVTFKDTAPFQPRLSPVHAAVISYEYEID